MSRTRTSRRRFLQLVASTGLASPAVLAHDGASSQSSSAARSPAAAIGDEILTIEFDGAMRSRVSRMRHGAHGSSPVRLTRWAASETLLLGDHDRVERFALQRQQLEPVNGPHGSGRRLTLVGASDSRTEAAEIEKTVRVTLHERYAGFALYKVSYRNLSTRPVTLRGWRSADLTLLPASAALAPGAARAGRAKLAAPQFWSYCGSTHADRRDWVQPLRPGFSQDNFMGMTASDYGGGTPVVDVWRPDCGIAVGHLESSPRLLSLPLRHAASGAAIAIAGALERVLAPGEQLELPETFLATHRGDYFVTLDTYRRIMGERGLTAPAAPPAAYEPIWCAWGYEYGCTPQLIETTLPKVEELGLKWVVIDDGWQSRIGDWQLSRAKYPRGDADMRALVHDIRTRGLLPRLWYTPLAAAPGSDLLHDHTDMLLLDRDGAPQAVSYWNCLYLCPAYDKTVTYTEALVRRFIGEWGFAGLKIDGQHVNGVAPCYNPAHRHARPEESVERLQDFLHAMYLAALSMDPQAVMELCPCGTAYSFFNFMSMNQGPASDPESSWQVRHKGKTLKALMGRAAAYAGDHVELSDGGDDFASTVGVGAVVSTKFTWPSDPKPKDSFLLTPQKEALWRKWIMLYNERRLPQGSYRGELYDIGFDRPETHVVEKDGRFYYACYAPRWQGPVTLRGLGAGRYRVRDYFNDHDLGEVTAADARLQLAFEGFVMLEAVPV